MMLLSAAALVVAVVCSLGTARGAQGAIAVTMRQVRGQCGGKEK